MWVRKNLVVLVTLLSFFCRTDVPGFTRPDSPLFFIADSFSARKAEADELYERAEFYPQQNIYIFAEDINSLFLQPLLKSIEIYRAIGDKQGEYSALELLNNFYISQKNDAEAIKNFDRQLVLAADLSPTIQFKAFNRCGHYYEQIERYDRAIEFYKKALEIAREFPYKGIETLSFESLGFAYYASRQYSQALAVYEQALQQVQSLARYNTKASILEGLGNTYRALGDYDRAVELQQQSLEALEDWSDFTTGKKLVNLGLTLFKAGQLDAAMAKIEAGITRNETFERQIFERERIQENEGSFEFATQEVLKLNLLSENVDAYRLQQKVAIAQGKSERALEIAERGRSRVLLSSLAQHQGLLPKDSEPLAVERIKQIARQRNSTLVYYSILYDGLNSPLKSLESDLLIWVIHPDGNITFRRVGLKPFLEGADTSLEQLVQNSRTTLGLRGRGLPTDRSTKNHVRPLHKLHQMLIQPIADFLPADPEALITFISDGILSLVPFAALRDASGTFLIEQHTLLNAPSLQLIAENIHPAPTGQDTLVVGNPMMPRLAFNPGDPVVQLSSLPEAEEEARVVASLLHTRALTGVLATKEAVLSRMPRSQTIHLATHGLLDDFSGLFLPGAIALAPTESDKGVLTTIEIMNLKLNADLVVLSACDTGEGRLTEDGIVGLSRAFLYAGARNLVVSLWAVSDAPTSFLMREFYQNLKQNPDKAVALRRAMLATKAKHPSPQDWAAFLLLSS